MKKVLSLFIVMLILINAFSYGAVEKTKEMNYELVSVVEEMLSSIIGQPENFGIDSADFKNLKLGKVIIPYSVSNEIYQLTNIEYYPVINDNNKVLGIVTRTFAEDDSSTITFGKDFAKELEIYLNQTRNGKIALIHYDGELYLADKTEVQKISDFGYEEETQSLSTLLNNKEINILNKLDKLNKVEVKSEVDIFLEQDSNKMSILSTPQSKILNLPVVSQGRRGLCWAAATASVGFYKTGIWNSAMKVADLMGKGYDEGGNIIDISNALSQIYSLNNTPIFSTLGATTIVNNIVADKPIIAAFIYSETEPGHAVAFAGYSMSSSGMILYVRDSNYGDLKIAYQASGGTFTLNYYSEGVYYYRQSVYLN